MKYSFKKLGIFTVLLLCTDIVFIFALWLIEPPAIKSVGLFLFLFSVGILTVALIIEHRRRKKIREAVSEFIETPNDKTERRLISIVGIDFQPCIYEAYQKMISQEKRIGEKHTELLSYREYIEAWVHETKTPLSLSTLILNNHKEEMSQYVFDRMRHIQHSLSENTDRILYYARLQTEHADYKFTAFELSDCVTEVISEHLTYTEENGIKMDFDFCSAEVISDRKTLVFILSQLFSNAFKYADAANGKVSVLIWKNGDKTHLAVRNNGKGIPPEDAPFIFDKGFTGSHPYRQKATGMGLYLVRKYAEKLCIDVVLEPISVTGEGFGIELVFSA